MMTVGGMRKALLYAMMVLGYMSMQLSGEVSPIATLLFYAGITVSWFWEPPRVDLKKWERMWTIATLGVFVFTILDIALLGEFFLISGRNFVLFLATAKLFQRAEAKDYTQAMALSLMLLAAGAVLNDNLSFGIVFAAYAILATIGLTTQHLSVELTKHRGDRGRSQRMEGAVLWATVSLGVLVFLGSAAFFFTFPRIGFGFFVQQSRSGVTTSGFGSDVTLGGHGTIRDDQTIVMRVVFPNGAPDMIDNIRFRGISLDRYDGRRWTDTDNERVNVRRMSEVNGYSLIRPRGVTAWDELIQGTVPMEVNLEPLDGVDILFTLGEPRALTLPNTLADVHEIAFSRAIRIDNTGKLTMRQRSAMGMRYVVYSRILESTPELMSLAAWPDDAPDLLEYARHAYRQILLARGEPIPAGEVALTPEVVDELLASDYFGENGVPRRLFNKYLQLPSNAITPRMDALLTEIRSEFPNAYDYTLAVETWLRRTLAYTTNLPQPSSSDANLVDEFLFEWRRGHCEYFATAMVVMLRAQGIPARIVNGFLGGDFNSVGNFYAVRQANAHSWVEVYFPDVGWITFDPTPSAPSMGGPAGRFARINMFIDNLRLKWFRWVVEYDLEKQFSSLRTAVQNIRGGSQGDAEAWMRELASKVGWWTWGNLRGIIAHLALLIGFALVFRHRAKMRIPWTTLDWIYAASWFSISVVVSANLWKDGFTAVSLIVGIVPPIVGVTIAYILRRDLFDPDGALTRARSKGSIEISHMYTRILRDVEAYDEGLPLSVTPRELLQRMPPMDDAHHEELSQFLTAYERARFSGEKLARADVRAWRRRLGPLRRAIRRALKESSRRTRRPNG